MTIEDRLNDIEIRLDPAAREAVRELVGELVDYHRTGLEHLLALMTGTPAQDRLESALRRDELVSGMLLLHDLHPWPLALRIERAIAELRGRVGDLDAWVVEAAPERVVLHMAGDHHLARRVEEAVGAAAPDVDSIEVKCVARTWSGLEGVVPAARLRRSPSGGVHRARCSLCGEEIEVARHVHLFDSELRSLDCACETCAVLLGAGNGRYRPVRPRGVRLDRLRIDDAAWRRLGVPVGLAYFSRRSDTGGVFACYPAPTGLVEAEVDELAWWSVVSGNPAVAELEPDLEALLVDRRRAAAERYYRLSIDECYRLVGLIRAAWQGSLGAPPVEAAIERFVASLGPEPAR